MSDIHTTTLPCGLRIVHEQTPSAVVHCGYIVGAGTRHEDAPDTGMAHFIEHMSFKGTARRRACHISNGLERVGGDLNAYTNKQETVYYAVVLRPDFGRAADLLTDIVFHSTYPQREIDREVEVICDEIESYKDSPADLIFDDFEAILYSRHPLGRDILGAPERLRSYTTADARRFADAHYRPANCVFFVRGDVRFERVVKTAERLLADMPACAPAPLPPTCANLPVLCPTVAERHRDTHQAHVVIGTRTCGGTDSRHCALLLLNNMLGGPGMNSRLNMSLREHAGLVYTVEAALTTYPDTGWWSVYFGCDPHDIGRCRRIVGRELRRFIDAPLTAAQLAAAKKQLCGQVGIAAEGSEHRALAMAKNYARYGTHYDPAEVCRRIAAITAADVQALAAEVYDADRLTTLVYE